jgi:hypothetical protein
MGLSKSDIDLLPKTLFNPLFELNKVAFKSTLELEQYEEANIEADEVHTITHYEILRLLHFKLKFQVLFFIYKV